MRLDWSSVAFRSMLLASLVVVAAVFAINQPKREAGQAANQRAHTEQSNESAPKTFWQKADEDPTAYFTMWLVIFTGVLSTVSIVQIGFLLRSDITARRSANAALLAAQAASRQADAAIGVEIPRISLSSFEFAPNEHSLSVTSLLQRGTFSAKFINHGRTSAFLTHAFYQTFIGVKLPDTPAFDEGPIFHLPSNEVIEAGSPYTFPIRRAEIPWAKVAEILEEKQSLWIYGYMEYRDFLGVEHREPFIRRFMPHKGLSKGYMFIESSASPEAYRKRW